MDDDGQQCRCVGCGCRSSSPGAGGRGADRGNSPTRVEGRCNEAGGVYFPPSSHGVYACLNSDGSGIICGGVGGFAKTCTTFGAQVVKGPKLPNRPAVIEAERQRLLKAQR